MCLSKPLKIMFPRERSCVTWVWTHLGRHFLQLLSKSIVKCLVYFTIHNSIFYKISFTSNLWPVLLWIDKKTIYDFPDSIYNFRQSEIWNLTAQFPEYQLFLSPSVSFTPSSSILDYLFIDAHCSLSLKTHQWNARIYFVVKIFWILTEGLRAQGHMERI